MNIIESERFEKAMTQYISHSDDFLGNLPDNIGCIETGDAIELLRCGSACTQICLPDENMYICRIDQLIFFNLAKDEESASRLIELACMMEE